MLQNFAGFYINRLCRQAARMRNKVSGCDFGAWSSEEKSEEAWASHRSRFDVARKWWTPHNISASLGIDSYKGLAYENTKGKGGEFRLRY